MTFGKQVIRAFEAADAEPVIEIADSLNLSHWSREDLLAELARPDAFLVVAIHKNKHIGFMVGRVVPGQRDGESDAEIYNIGVSRANQLLGVGGRLLRSFLSHCRSENVKAIWLEVRAGNVQAIRFYRNFGFVHFGDRRNFYNDPAEDALILKLDLR